MFKHLTIFFVVLLNFSCTNNLNDRTDQSRSNYNKYAGLIDSIFVEELTHRTKFGDTIILTSLGGAHNDSINASKIILEKKLNVIIEDFCISACAEIILPSANTILFREDPIIAFHWGPQLISNLIREKTGTDIVYCSFKQEKDIHDLYINTGHNPNFWTQIAARIRVKKTNVYLGVRTCPKIKIVDLENDLWIPSSRQLKDQLNLNFTGSVCADNFDNCKIKITTLWDKNANYLITDNVFKVTSNTTTEWRITK